MRRGTTLFALISLVLVSLACNQVSEEDVKAAKDAEEWAWIAQAKVDLDAKRGELATLHERIATFQEPAEDAPATEEGTDGEAPLTAEALAEQAKAVEQEAQGLTESFLGRLIQFINDQQIGVESEPTDIQRQALAFKSDEDILLAREYIDKGGEYQRAIDIYSQALVFDPDNEKLAVAKAEAESLRFMTEERLAGVKKGMSREEVRAVLGTPKHHNVREYDNGTIAWFYPKEEPHTASAVFFQDKKGEMKIYKTDFNAIKAEQNDS